MTSVNDPILDNLLEDAKRLIQTEPAIESNQENKYISSIKTGFQPPIKGTWYNSGGFTYNPNPTHPKGHPAVDMRALSGTPIYPLTSGIVKYVGNNDVGGNFINIQHSPKLSSYYAHLSTVAVHQGDSVNNDTLLGTVGNTGSAKNTYPHLHLEVTQNGSKVDPAKFFTIPQYTDPKNNPEEAHINNYWTSEADKKAAQSFNMSAHKAKKPVFSSRIDGILKLASEFYLLSKY